MCSYPNKIGNSLSDDATQNKIVTRIGWGLIEEDILVDTYLEQSFKLCILGGKIDGEKR